MRSLVTIGWELRWIPLGHNPMLGVKYTAGATEQGQQAEFVREPTRMNATVGDSSRCERQPDFSVGP